MRIEEIYTKYSIPENLQQHMLRVATLGKIICDHLQDIKVDSDTIVKTLLLHDMGNILKFDLSQPELFSKRDQQRVGELKKIKQEFKQKYGNHPDNATAEIIKEETSGKKILDLFTTSHWQQAEKMVGTDFWDRKVTCYSDMRIGPFGILKLSERFKNLSQRRPEEKEALKVILKHGHKIEQEIQNVLDIDLNQITNEMIEKEFHKLKKIKF